ncbi:helix-turn-helix transcriptional regulator [Ferrimonas pelagia]
MSKSNLINVDSDVVTERDYRIHAGWSRLLALGEVAKDLRALRDQLFALPEQNRELAALLKATERVDPLIFDAYSLAIWTAPSLQQALEVAAHFSAILCVPLRLHLHQTQSGGAELWVFDHLWERGDTPVSTVGATLYLATLIRLFQKASGGCSLEVMIGPWPYASNQLSVAERTLQCRIQTDSRLRKLCFCPSQLERPLPQSNEAIHSNSKSLLREQLALLEQHNMVVKVHTALFRQADLTGVDSGRIAGQIGISVRTLNRRLAVQKTSFRRLLDEHRLERAMVALSLGQNNLTDIAYQLGFSDLSSFSRAFKRWTGYSPTEGLQLFAK